MSNRVRPKEAPTVVASDKRLTGREQRIIEKADAIMLQMRGHLENQKETINRLIATAQELRKGLVRVENAEDLQQAKEIAVEAMERAVVKARPLAAATEPVGEDTSEDETPPIKEND